MTAVAGNTPLAAPHRKIAAAPGSPYFLPTVVIKCGGRILRPFKFTSLTIGQYFDKNSADDTILTMEFAMGDAVYYIAPFKDDIKVTIQHNALTERLATIPGSGFKRTYNAFLATELPSPSRIGGMPSISDVERANRQGIITVVMKLEEIATTQFKKMSYGTDFSWTTPFAALMTFLDHSIKRLKLPQDQGFKGVHAVAPDNETPRANVVIPDGTPLMDMADYIQNFEGGIYNAAMGFYVHRDYVYLWPLYNTKRLDTAQRVLRIYIAPDRYRSKSDRTWILEGRRLEIWCASDVKHFDDASGMMNIEGTGVRYMDANRLLSGFAEVGDGKLEVKRGENTNEFAAFTPINGEQLIRSAEVSSSSNTFRQASRLSKRMVATLGITWQHADPTLIYPDMAVEIVYDRLGIVKKMTGSLTGTISQMQGIGDRQNNLGAACDIVLSVAVDRQDPAFQEWIDQGAVGRSTPPEIES